MLFDIKTLLSVVNLDHQRWIILLNHPTSRLSTQLCSVFFFCCSFLNDFPFLALVVKPVIYLSQRRRKTKENHFLYIPQFRLSFCILKTIIRNDKREDVFWQWKRRSDMQYWSSTFCIFHAVLLCLDTFRCNYIENSWNILNIRKQTPNMTTTQTSRWGSLLWLFCVSRVRNE